jgi:hypothetical protein
LAIAVLGWASMPATARAGTISFDPADVNTDSFVDDDDLQEMLGAFGDSVLFGDLRDLNFDGVINTLDVFRWVDYAVVFSGASVAASPEAWYNPANGNLSVVPHGNPIYGFIFNGVNPLSFTADNLPKYPSTTANAWELITGSLHGVDQGLSFNSTTSTLQSNTSLDFLTGSAVVAQLATGLDASTLGTLQFRTTNGTQGSVSIMSVPEASQWLTLAVTGALAWLRGRKSGSPGGC